MILAFHGHEPLWDLPSKILARYSRDEAMYHSVPSENWIKIRAEAHRDVYSDLLGFAETLGVPVALEATNELLTQLAQFAPETHRRLQDGYRSGRLYPVYGHAHHGHIALLTAEEMSDEIRLNAEYLHEVMNVPRPKYRGLFPTEDSIDASKLNGLHDADIDFVIFPNLDPTKARYESDKPFNEQHDPFVIGEGMIALPRHFPVSQGIWRPVTRMRPTGVKYQGYLLGRYWVFDEEYRRHRFVSFPIDRQQGVDEYQALLERALHEAPDRGLILYIQDLELMDFGDVALDVMLGAWQKVRAEGVFDIRFVTPDEYLDSEVRARVPDLPRLRFHQLSWAPEIRLVLRYDGHYPPLGAGEFRQRDIVTDVFRRWPFIFWEPGRYLKRIANNLVEAFGYRLTWADTAPHLAEVQYDPAKLSDESRVALHTRLIGRACNWGWFPNESLQKRPFLHGYALADLLLRRLDQPSVAATVDRGAVVLADRWLLGLGQLLEIIIDTRHSYLLEGITRVQAATGQDQAAAIAELGDARRWRDEAERRINIIRAKMKSPNGAGSPISREGLRQALMEWRAYCRAVFLAIDHLQRAWMCVADTEAVLIAMYDHLYQLYPPKFPAILESTLTEEELLAVEHPVLS